MAAGYCYCLGINSNDFFLKDNKKAFILGLNVSKVTAYSQNNKNKENMIEIKKMLVPSDMIHVKPIMVKEEVHYSVSPKGRKTENISKPKESIRDSIKRVMHLRKANPSTNHIRYSK